MIVLIFQQQKVSNGELFRAAARADFGSCGKTFQKLSRLFEHFDQPSVPLTRSCPSCINLGRQRRESAARRTAEDRFVHEGWDGIPDPPTNARKWGRVVRGG